jgi:hypothetical protein
MWVASLPKHDDETTTIHVPRLLDAVLQSPEPAIDLAEALFQITATSSWSNGNARIIENILGLTSRHVLASINMGMALLELNVLSPKECQQWKLDLLDALQKVSSTRQS